MLSVLLLLIFTIERVSVSNGLLHIESSLESANNTDDSREKENSVKNKPADREYFVQKLDHFNPTDVRTWMQLYHCEDAHYKKGGPVYLSYGGKASTAEGYWAEHGRQHNALICLLERRFYEHNQPLNLSTENLRYLTTSQMLADSAAFVVSMNQKYRLPDNAKWIIFGGSHSGNLAAWMRLKYPHLVYAAVASSAPVLAKVDFNEYYEAVGDALASYDKRCKDDVALANKDVDKLVRTARGRQKIDETFNGCTRLTGNKLDAAFFFANMANYISNVVQYDKGGKDVKRVCDKMLENADKEKPINRYANVIKMLTKERSHECCPTNFTNHVEYVKKIDVISSMETNRPWVYQSCTEYGFYFTSNQKKNIFSKRISLNLYLDLCSKVFGTIFNKEFINQRVDHTLTNFGGLKIDKDRLLFVQGLADPWRSLGVTNTNNNKKLDVINIKGGSHCSDLLSPTSNEQQEVETARKEITKKLDEWIKE